MHNHGLKRFAQLPKTLSSHLGYPTIPLPAKSIEDYQHHHQPLQSSPQYQMQNAIALVALAESIVATRSPIVMFFILSPLRSSTLGHHSEACCGYHHT